MQKLIAKRTATMEDGRAFIQEGKEYSVIKEDEKFIHVHTEITEDHMFYRSGNEEGFYGNYFLLEGEQLQEEVVEEVKEPTEESAEEKSFGSSTIKRSDPITKGTSGKGIAKLSNVKTNVKTLENKK